MVPDNPKQIRLAFVDEHAAIHGEFKNSLAASRPEWSTKYFDKGERFLSDLERRDYDMVISDLQLTGLEGGELLRLVARKAPSTVRVVAFDIEKQPSIMRHVDAWNQFITKPFEMGSLVSVVEDSLSLNDQRPELSVVEVIKNLKRLPTIPAIYVELNKLLEKPDVTPEDIGDLVARDIALTSSLLRIVNSAQIGLRRNVSTPHEAVDFMGVEIVKTLALGAKLFTMCDEQILRLPYLYNLWDHSMNVSGYARRIMLSKKATRKMVDESMVAGLLHDAGKLVLATNDPQKTMEVMRLCKEQNISTMKAEDEVFGFNHGDVGGVLFRLWGLPPKVVEAVKFHHLPRKSDQTEISAVAALHLAEMVSQPVGWDGRGQRNQGEMDAAYLREVGLEGDIEDWKQQLASPQEN